MFGHDDAANQSQSSVDTTSYASPADTTTPTTTDTPSAPTAMPDPLDAALNSMASATPVDTAAPSTASTPSDPTTPAVNDDLLDIKQQALQQLSPLVGHLDQTPEEKFRTTMMMIQASDDQSLIKAAYEAAQQITDEKTRAQALLDVVNEINYFTQQQQQ